MIVGHAYQHSGLFTCPDDNECINPSYAYATERLPLAVGSLSYAYVGLTNRLWVSALAGTQICMRMVDCLPGPLPMASQRHSASRE